MLITKRELIEMNACENGLYRFIEQTGGTEDPIDVATLVGGVNNYYDLLWLVGEKIPKDRIVRFACDCVAIDIELAKPYVEKYNEIIEFLSNPTTSAPDISLDSGMDHEDWKIKTSIESYDAATRAANAFGPLTASVYASFAADSITDSGKVNKLLIEMFNEY